MADPLLNTLCTVCHINAPKYVCPGCSAQTCSLPCTKRHKSWANCSGRRDPAAFMPASRLKTPAGIDHDYNFLSAIERERARNQRDLVEDRKLFTERDVRAMEDDSRFRKHWLGDSVRFDPVRGGPRTFGEDGGDEDDVDNEDNENHTGGGGDGPEGGSNVPARASYLTRQVRQRLDGACIQVVQMPVGMSRQRENTTSWNRKSRSINWCVEWMVYDGGCEAAHTRIRHKALESVPLYKALGNSMAWYRKGQQHKGEPDDENEDKDDEEEPAYARKRRRVLIKEVREDEGRRTAMQDAASATWATATPYPSQNPYTATWGLDRGPSATSWLPDGEVEARRGYRFYLLKPLTPAGKPRELIPVAAAETLSSALQGRTVLEYPTFYVLPPPDSPSPSTPTPVLPEGYILGPTERRERSRRNNNNNNNKFAKRKATDSNNNKKNDKSQPPAKRQAMTAGGDDGGDGIPIRGPNHNQRGGRGGARGGRGGGRLQQQQQQARGGGGGGKRPAQDAEEGEINSDGDEVPRKTAAAAAAGRRRPDRAAAAADHADTSSSDPDTSSDEEEEGEEAEEEEEEEEDGEQGLTLKPSPRGGHDAMHVDVDEDEDHDGPPEETRSTAAAAGKRKSSGLGLVEYGSDSDGSDEDGDEGDEDVDLAGLKPENPELVASAIKEIVGLLT